MTRPCYPLDKSIQMEMHCRQLKIQDGSEMQRCQGLRLGFRFGDVESLEFGSEFVSRIAKGLLRGLRFGEESTVIV